MKNTSKTVAPFASSTWVSQVRIRHVMQDDLPALEWDGEYSHFRRLYQEIYESTCRGKAVMWLAELPGVGVIGQLFLQLDSARPELADGGSRAYIYGVRVKSAYRRQGIGTRLMQTAEDYLIRRNFRWVTLNVAQDNPQARKLYERMGYHIVSADDGRWSYQDEAGIRHEVHEPSWRMEKQLISRG